MKVLSTICYITIKILEGEAMNDVKLKRLQKMLITHLLEVGKVELLLPDGFNLEIGILQENKRGDLIKTSDYCYVIASKETNATLIDSYNLGLRYEEDKDKILCECESLDQSGRRIKNFDVV